MEKLNSFSHERGELASRPPLSFYECLEVIKNQVEIHTVTLYDRAFAEELCKIITEVMRLPDDAAILIEGERMPCTYLSEMFSYLRAEHIEYVIRQFKSIGYPIRRKKQYLRTLLYNSLFEIEADSVNEFENMIK